MAAPRKIDWERVEPDWRAGIKSVLQIAADYAAATGQTVSHTAINKHFRKLGVPRDLSAKVQAKAEAMVSAAMVAGLGSTETTASDAEIINVSAAAVAEVRLTHRKDIRKGRELVARLLDELSVESISPEALEQFAEVVAADRSSYIEDPDKRDKAFAEALATFLKMTNLPARAGVMQKLAAALKELINLEREAYGIDDKRGLTDVPAQVSITF